MSQSAVPTKPKPSFSSKGQCSRSKKQTRVVSTNAKYQLATDTGDVDYQLHRHPHGHHDHSRRAACLSSDLFSPAGKPKSLPRIQWSEQADCIKKVRRFDRAVKIDPEWEFPKIGDPNIVP